MGLLDEAIREHLELRRLRGVDPSEIERDEQAALGSPDEAATPVEAGGWGEHESDAEGWEEPVGPAEPTPAASDAAEGRSAPIDPRELYASEATAELDMRVIFGEPVGGGRPESSAAGVR